MTEHRIIHNIIINYAFLSYNFFSDQTAAGILKLFLERGFYMFQTLQIQLFLDILIKNLDLWEA